MITKENRQRFINQVTAYYPNSHEIVRWLKTDYTDLYHKIINSVIAETLPHSMDANVTNTPHRMEVELIKSHEDMADDFIEFTDVDDEPDAIDDIINQKSMYDSYFMMNMADYFDISVILTIEETCEDLDIDKLSELIEDDIDDNPWRYEDAIRQYDDDLVEQVSLTCIRQGISTYTVDVMALDYNIIDIKPRVPYSEIAERLLPYLDDRTPEQLINSGVHLSVVCSTGTLTYGIEIISNPNDPMNELY